MGKEWYRQGQALLREIEQTCWPETLVSLWYIGQMGMVVKWKDRVLCLDPVLGAMPGADGADRRQYPAPFAPSQLRADVVFCTHDHGDHLHPETLIGLLAANPRLTIVVPQPLTARVQALGIPVERILGACQGERLYLGDGFTVDPIATAHESYQYDAAGRSLTLGYVLQLGAFRLFHSGDTVVTPELLAELQPYGSFDAAMLPINGRDLERNRRDIVGNMDAREAAWLSREIGADLTIPLHYDLIAGNREDPLVFASRMERLCPTRKYHIFRLGERYLLAAKPKT